MKVEVGQIWKWNDGVYYIDSLNTANDKCTIQGIISDSPSFLNKWPEKISRLIEYADLFAWAGSKWRYADTDLVYEVVDTKNCANHTDKSYCIEIYRLFSFNTNINFFIDGKYKPILPVNCISCNTIRIRHNIEAELAKDKKCWSCE